jgi:hypothetical protein
MSRRLQSEAQWKELLQWTRTSCSWRAAAALLAAHDVNHTVAAPSWEPERALPHSFFKLKFILPFHPRLSLPNRIFQSHFLTEWVSHLSHLCLTPVLLILLDLFTMVISGKEYELVRETDTSTISRSHAQLRHIPSPSLQTPRTLINTVTQACSKTVPRN